jgi:Predicted acetyltransferase
MTIEWQPMRYHDLAEVVALSKRIHPGLPEDRAVQAKRLTLWPDGCKVLQHDQKVMGYTFAHPIPAGDIPRLNTAPDRIEPDSSEFYLHDIAVDPAVHGRGLAALIIRQLLAEAQAYESSALISVYGTAPFWERFGFAPVVGDEMAERLASYGEGAVFMRRLNRPPS